MDDQGRPQLSLMSRSDVPVYLVPGLVLIAAWYRTAWFPSLPTGASGFFILVVVAYVVGLLNRWILVAAANWLWAKPWSNRWKEKTRPIPTTKLAECKSYQEMIRTRCKLTKSLYGLIDVDGEAVEYLSARILAKADPEGYQRMGAMSTLEVSLTCLATSLLLAGIGGSFRIGSCWLAGLGLAVSLVLWDRAARIRELMAYRLPIYHFAALKIYGK